MHGIRRLGFIFGVLVIGILLGSLGAKTALLIITPLFLFWFMLWDEKSYRRRSGKPSEHNPSYAYRR